MSRKPRILQSGYSYHVTIRCNNREFRLIKLECRQKLFWDELNIDNEEIQQVASKFVKANCYNPNPNLSESGYPGCKDVQDMDFRV